MFRRAVLACLLCLVTACLVIGIRWYSYVRTIQRLSAIEQDYWHGGVAMDYISELPHDLIYVDNIGFVYQGPALLKDWLGDEVSCILCGVPTELALVASHLTKKHIPDVESLPSIVAIDLQDCQTVSDTEVRLLCQLRGLRCINLHGCNVSDECLAEMSAQYPDLKLMCPATSARRRLQ